VKAAFLRFPDRIYTEDEVKQAKTIVDQGYKHQVQIIGSPDFKTKVKEALELVKVAGFDEFFRTYIRSIKEIDGLTQLRQAEAAIWANTYAVENEVDAASLFVQKANHMREYLEGKLYYGGEAERRSFEKRREFLEVLKKKSHEKDVTEECERLLQMWKEGSLVY
jgi:hypothetical protein